TDPVSIAVALADKLDTLVGFWAIDEKPTGSKDPYALRRAALGVIRIIVENGVHLRLRSRVIERSALALLIMLKGAEFSEKGATAFSDTIKSVLSADEAKDLAYRMVDADESVTEAALLERNDAVL